jgi:hypothetical protein
MYAFAPEKPHELFAYSSSELLRVHQMMAVKEVLVS